MERHRSPVLSIAEWRERQRKRRYASNFHLWRIFFGYFCSFRDPRRGSHSPFSRRIGIANEPSASCRLSPKNCDSPRYAHKKAYQQHPCRNLL